jgi:hypothetical protein
MEMKRESDRDGGGTYIMFSKNRNGAAGIRYNYRLSNNDIFYDLVTENSEPSGKEFQLEMAEEAF